MAVCGSLWGRMAGMEGSAFPRGKGHPANAALSRHLRLLHGRPRPHSRAAELQRGVDAGHRPHPGYTAALPARLLPRRVRGEGKRVPAAARDHPGRPRPAPGRVPHRPACGHGRSEPHPHPALAAPVGRPRAPGLRRRHRRQLHDLERRRLRGRGRPGAGAPPADAGSGMTITMDAPVRHEPVLLHETRAALAVRPGGRYVDCTVDGGGHAEAILDAASPGGALVGIDADPEALALARHRLSRFGDAVALVEGNFRDVDAICRERGFTPVNGVLFDLGLSSHQLASATRGFSFRVEAPLDMRFGPGPGRAASYWVNEASESELADLIWRFGEDPRSRRIARAIVRSRPLATTTQLAK